MKYLLLCISFIFILFNQKNKTKLFIFWLIYFLLAAVGPVEADPEYLLIVEANNLAVEIDNEISKLHSEILSLLLKLFTKLFWKNYMYNFIIELGEF